VRPSRVHRSGGTPASQVVLEQPLSCRDVLFSGTFLHGWGKYIPYDNTIILFSKPPLRMCLYTGRKTGFSMEFNGAHNEGGGLQHAAWSVGKMKTPSEARRLPCHKMSRIWRSGSPPFLRSMQNPGTTNTSNRTMHVSASPDNRTSNSPRRAHSINRFALKASRYSRTTMNRRRKCPSVRSG
jgi:hypothetical protein